MSEMTSRERWLCLLEKRTPDRIPCDYQSVSEFSAKLMATLGCRDFPALCGRLHIDAPLHVGPRLVHQPYPDEPDRDLWGVRYAPVDYGTGVYREAVEHPLAQVRSVREVDAYPWPDPDWFDYSTVTQQIQQSDGTRIISAGCYEPMLLYGYLRGLEQSYEDLLVEPDIADAILTHLFDFHYEYLQRTYAAGQGRIDTTKLAEDLGGQSAPIFSLDTYKRFLLPNQKRMADLMRQHHLWIFYHTDGAARPFLPYLVHEVGIHILNPIQWRCPGMERDALVRDFGAHVVFHGAMDNQQTLPFGTVDDVLAELDDNMRYFADARWICAPCHNIQAVTPPENVIAMYDALWEHGRLPAGAAG